MEATRPLAGGKDPRRRAASSLLPEVAVPEGDRTCSLAVLVPCHNEERAIAAVVRGFHASLPHATIYVYDNGSTDATSAVAEAAGAIVRREPRRGKGNVMRRMFADVDADLYVLVDGDDTYDACAASLMVELLQRERLDMVVGSRRPVTTDSEVYRPGHTAGNAMFSRLLQALLGGGFSDILSGYRVMSRRLVKSFPVQSTGFEIETELSAHAVEVGATCAELPASYRSRSAGSTSKLHTYRDGFRILISLFRLWEAMRPLQFFALWFGLLTALSLVLAIPVITEFEHTGYVARFPTAILATAIQIVAFLTLACGIILKSVRRARQEVKRLAYLQHPAPPFGSAL